MVYLLLFMFFSLIGLAWTLLERQRRKNLEIVVLQRTQKIREDKATIESQAERLQELDKAKTRFFANISHEFRTPLTIISGMIDQVEKNPNRWLSKGASMIRRNNAYLLDLINQILDLRKLEAGSLHPELQSGNIIDFLKTISEQFQALAQSKGLVLHFETGTEKLYMNYDPDKTLRIVSNLLSNAIKFSPDKGQVTFSISTVNGQRSTTYNKLILTISDSGPGISKDQLPFIFDRFYQVTTKGKTTASGTGIGLALTKELVQLLQGEIEVVSKVEQGTTFRVILPITQDAKPGQSVDPTIIQGAIFGTKRIIAKEPAPNADTPIALIVEDNPDIAQYLKICLEGSYQLTIASNGQEGIDMALEHIPDIIISDVMMPGKDGFELCETLKEDERTSHIPIVLLTARADFDSRISGLKSGADAYLAKPFEPEELLVRLEQLLLLRRKLQEKYLGQAVSGEAIHEEGLPSEDAFIQKVRKVILEHMEEEDFDVHFLCREIGARRSQLHKKIKALTGLSTTALIRSIRLSRAKTLLQTTDLNVSEIGYEVGINNPAYFSRIYAESFGETPIQTRKRP